jgi:hypothetical protein
MAGNTKIADRGPSARSKSSVLQSCANKTIESVLSFCRVDALSLFTLCATNGEITYDSLYVRLLKTAESPPPPARSPGHPTASTPQNIRKQTRNLLR